MFYQHTLLITDHAAGFAPDRRALWTALTERARNPVPFLPGLQGFRVLAAVEGRIERELDFGGAKVRDRVTLDEDRGTIRFEVAGTSAHAGGALTIEIGELAGGLGLTFTYRTTLEDVAGADGVAPAEYVRAAYQASDRDTVAVIRRLLGYRSAGI